MPIEGSRMDGRRRGRSGQHLPVVPRHVRRPCRPASRAGVVDSIFRQYAAWGVDYVKVDDISGGGGAPATESYRDDEIAAIRRAIDNVGGRSC